MGDLALRKPLDAQFVGKINQAAMKALGNVVARRKWPDSSAGSPVTTNLLCAEIARLNLVLKEAAHYVACCPPPPEATGDLRISLLEQRALVAKAARGNAAPAEGAAES